MAQGLIKKELLLGRSFPKEHTQILLEGDIIVPDVKPDMSIMLQADSKININKIEVSNDRVNYMGKMHIQILYLAKGNDKPVYSMSASAEVDDFINIAGVTQDCWVNVEAQIQNIDYKMINDRKISYRAVVEIICTAEKNEGYDVVVDIEGLAPSQQLRESLVLSKPVSRKRDRFAVKDELSVPHGKPNIREILQVNVEIAGQDVKVLAGKINISGELIVTTLYKGDSGDSIIEFLEHELPFNGHVDISGASDDMYGDVKLSLQDQHIQIRPDEDGEDRIIEVEASVGVIAKISAVENIEVLEDAYSITQKLDMHREKIKYPKLISRNKNQSTVKEVISLDQTCPDILQVFRIKGRVMCDEVKVINDKVVAEGAIETNVIYIAESDDTPLYSYKTSIPFRQVIETKGSDPEMGAHIDVDIDHVAFNMLSGREVEIRFMLSFNTSVTKTLESELIREIEFSPIDPEILERMPSITVYVVAPGDSLWKIAKRYNTGIDEIMAINDIENPSKIYPGQKILILKKLSLPGEI